MSLMFKLVFLMQSACHHAPVGFVYLCHAAALHKQIQPRLCSRQAKQVTTCLGLFVYQNHQLSSKAPLKCECHLFCNKANVNQP